MEEYIDYMPVHRTAVEEGNWIKLQEKIEQIKKEMGDKYLLSKAQEVKRNE